MPAHEVTRPDAPSTDTLTTQHSSLPGDAIVSCSLLEEAAKALSSTE
jgi:hypothetical protein